MNREALGRIVRDTWVKWAREQPDPKPSWLLDFDEIDGGQREVDCRIGEAVAAAERARLADRSQMIDEIKNELDDTFQFVEPDGSRYSHVSRSWVEALLAISAASAGAAELGRCIQLARQHTAVSPEPGTWAQGKLFADILREQS